MESDSNFHDNINDIQLQSKDSIKKDKNNKYLYNIYDPPEKEKENNDTSLDDLENNKNINDLIPKDLMNKMTLISPIPKQNLPQKKAIIEKLEQEKEESFEEKEEEDFSPEEEDSDDSSDIEQLKENVNIKNNNEKNINKKSVQFKLDSNKEQTNT